MSITLTILLQLFLAILPGCKSEDIEIQKEKTVLFGDTIPAHPRLLFTPEDEKRIRELKNSDPLLNDLFGLLKNKADALLADPMVEYTRRDMNYAQDILTISREHVYRILTLSLAYRLLGDKKYGQKAEENLLNVCRYPDWNPSHYLDVAEMTTAVAIGYDWLFDFLAPETKNLIKKSMKEKALDHAIPEYLTGNSSSWAKRETNWNVVCNAGMIMGALAIAEENPKLTEMVISYGTQFVPNCLTLFKPDGVCYEGPGYWDYTNTYLSMMLKALNDNFGNDSGISDLPGIKNTVNYYISSVSPGGKVFNFADAGGTSPSKSAVYFYFSRMTGQAEAAVFYRKLLADIVKNPQSLPRWHYFLCIPWYDNSSAVSGSTPKLQIFRNDYNPIAVFNGDQSVENSIYLIAKGGAPDKAHQQLDVGTFIVETNGIRWTDDLGADNYSLEGFWDYKPDGLRWHYFRNTNFSHNTLAIDGKLQYSEGKGTLLRYNTQSGTPFCIMDMTSVYKDQASLVHRGFMMPGDDLMLIQDEVKTVPGSQYIEWSAITAAGITVEGNKVVLDKGGSRFYISVVRPEGVQITVQQAKTFTSGENPITGYSLLKIKVTSVPDQVQTIALIMGSNPASVNGFAAGNIKSLSEWK